MGLFKRRDPHVVEVLAQQVATLKARLDEVAIEKETLSNRLTDLEHRPEPKPSMSPDELMQRFRFLEQTIAAKASEVRELAETQHSEMTDRVGVVESRHVADFDRVNARVAEIGDHLTGQLREVDNELDAHRQSVNADLLARHQSLATDLAAKHAELTDQLAALEARHGERIDAIDAATVGGRPETLDELRNNQARIANELARHQVAIRTEMAALVERLGPRARPPMVDRS